jgi:hypothetical protein
VQAAGGDVGAAAELAPGVQLGEHHLDPAEAGPRLLVDRDAAAVVDDLRRPVVAQGHVNGLTVTAQRLVDGVVDDLPQAVHQPARVGRADVHPRPLTHGLETLENEEMMGVVGVVHAGAGPLGCHFAP